MTSQAGEPGQGRARPLPRFVPLGAKLALGTVLVLLAVSGLLFVQLTGREQESLLAAKSAATSLGAGVVANSLVAPLDFKDAEAATEEMRHLRASQDLLYVGAWLGDEQPPFAELRQVLGAEAAVRPAPGERTTRHPEYIDQVRPIMKGEKVLGVVLLRFTLAPENAAYHESRQRFFWLAVLLAGGTSAVLLVLARLLIVSPLGALVIAARQLGEGAPVRVQVRANDEMGRLGGAFNAMAESIADRERRLAAATTELQQVLDNMGQAILVFGPGGHIEGAPSRQSAQLFGDLTEGQTVASLLFPSAAPGDVEARAFDVWIEEAFRVPADLFADLAELAPTEIQLAAREGAPPDPITLEVAFRHLASEGEGRRVMLVATDVTEKRRLERAVRQLDDQHAQQMAAIRRLLAGGGQGFVAFAEEAEQRLVLCEAALEADDGSLTEGQIEQIFRQVHTLKGEARGFGLERLLEEASAIEALLAPLRARAREGEIQRQEHAPALRAAVARARAAIEEGKEVFVAASPIGRAALDRISVDRRDLLALEQQASGLPAAISALIERLTSRPLGEATLGLLESVPIWAAQEGKQIRLELPDREVRVPRQLQRVLPGILAHLVRNSIAHGIEPPARREAAGKDPVGTIAIRCEPCAGGVRVTVEDDGAGLDEAALQAQGAAIGLDPGERRPEALAFLAGVSSAPAVSEVAGRGVGLAAVREEARAVGYEATLTSLAAQGVCFVVGPCPVPQAPETPRA